MVQVTIFSGHDGQLSFDNVLYLTLFGGCDLVRPTAVHQYVSRREAQRGGRAPVRRPFFLTLFGGVDIKAPTLTQEYLELRQMVAHGVVTMAEWDRAMVEVDIYEGGIGSFTLFGGFDQCGLPSENEEIDSLAVQRHLGNISPAAGDVLQLGIGQRGAERQATVRRAVLAEE